MTEVQQDLEDMRMAATAKALGHPARLRILRLLARTPGCIGGDIVEAVGLGVTSVAPGDRVACAGAGYANHAELICVPENLVAPVPPGVPLEQAAFSTLGSIALQCVRIADPTLGEAAAVVGLGGPC